jgi:hypothetical protein
MQVALTSASELSIDAVNLADSPANALTKAIASFTGVPLAPFDSLRSLMAGHQPSWVALKRKELFQAKSSRVECPE